MYAPRLPTSELEKYPLSHPNVMLAQISRHYRLDFKGCHDIAKLF